ncbi:MAG: nitroreductase family deazaflavin-dependent oxidoreductase [Solirubrobacterales bacterium]|nr:nitroreductase family deazaflavin-dependent oxidoreductase [Solirubrobacterales bacterium]
MNTLERTVGIKLLQLHHELYVRSGGRIGQGWLGVPCLLLTTTGAKSGLERVNSLTYAEDDGQYVLVASKGGAPQSPAWFHNAKANPQVKVQIGTRKFDATAHVVRKGDADYDRLWKLANDNNKNRYDAYQRATERPIPILVLRPKSS